MARSELLTIVVITIVMAISVQQAEALKCWSCSYDSRDPTLANFCKDHFDANSISDRDKWAYQECKAKPDQSVHCKKSVENVNNATIISRACFYKPLNATKEQCVTNSLSAVTTEFCGICETDGCNGANSIVGSAALFFVAPLAIATIFSN